MPKLQRLRTDAFHAQKGRCCYCSLPMWNASPDELKPLGLRPKTATPLRCTAEHLVAQQDGGKDVAGNIAAACWLCNTRRHKRKSPPSPEAYRALVQKRLAKGKWHPPVVAKMRVKAPGTPPPDG
ncbi:TPA: HNH endonuclease [Stenotrophomonas maltophilia]|nr:HNH endonuclease [Stenotrophomonas maltophilia]HDS1027277.1 HNH endonuclease [Stenotrophomonas maltophilia]HDS1031706.1 HNH endonuclease [Stenotrophomonas maltophilia]HDS1036077.1 HNH endonuclease [Stenotrophomonas maltophilia]